MRFFPCIIICSILGILIPWLPLPLAAQTEPSYPLKSNDISMLVMRMRDPYKRTGDQEIDSMTTAQIQSKLAAVAQKLAAILQGPADQRSRIKSNAVSDLEIIGPPAAGVVPIIARLLDLSSTREYYVSPSFCELTKVLRSIGPGEKETGNALGRNLLRVQRDTPTGVCHMCGCALDAIAATRPPASESAAPFLVNFMKGKNTKATYNWQLNNALQTAKPAGMEFASLQHLEDRNVHPDEKIGLINQMRTTVRKMSATEQRRLYLILRGFLNNDYSKLRAAAVYALSLWRTGALDALTAGLKDAQADVRRAAARGLATLGQEAAPATELLIENLDPILGATTEVGSALVAIGGARIAAMIRAKAPKEKPWAEYYADVAKAVEKKNTGSLKSILTKSFAVSSNFIAIAEVEERTGPYLVVTEKPGGGMAWSPDHHRLTVNYRRFRYVAPGSATLHDNGSLEIYKMSNTLWGHLKGVQAGQKLKIYLSPQLAQDPWYGVKSPTPHSSLPSWQPTVFEVSVEDVCEPKFWTLWKGSGIIGPMIFEGRCAR